jgi:hypothetical protein
MATSNQVSKATLGIAVVAVLGAIIYVSGEDIPTPAPTPAPTPVVVTVETITESEAKAIVSKDVSIDLINLGDDTVLLEIAGYDNPTVDDLPPLTLDGSHLPDMAGYESPSADKLPPLES